MNEDREPDLSAIRQEPLREEEALALLREGTIGQCQLLPEGSNYAFLATISADGTTPILAVYKPRKGETPLWDFPYGTLFLREYAAYVVSEALGWSFVPPTVIREGPYGIGSLQLYVAAMPGQNYFTLRDQRIPEMQRIAAFDCLVNNADRKGGHCLLDRYGRLWCIDHGLTFHALPKLRTVIWDFAGLPIPDSILRDLQNLRPVLQEGTSIHRVLERLLCRDEVVALCQRLETLLKTKTYPHPGPRRSVPWPPI